MFPMLCLCWARSWSPKGPKLRHFWTWLRLPCGSHAQCDTLLALMGVRARPCCPHCAYWAQLRPQMPHTQDQVAHAKPNGPKLRHVRSQSGSSWDNWPEFGASYAQVGPKWICFQPNLRPRTAKFDASRLPSLSYELLSVLFPGLGRFSSRSNSNIKRVGENSIKHFRFSYDQTLVLTVVHEITHLWLQTILIGHIIVDKRSKFVPCLIVVHIPLHTPFLPLFMGKLGQTCQKYPVYTQLILKNGVETSISGPKPIKHLHPQHISAHCHLADAVACQVFQRQQVVVRPGRAPMKRHQWAQMNWGWPAEELLEISGHRWKAIVLMTMHGLNSPMFTRKGHGDDLKNLVWDMNLGTKTMGVAWFSMVGRRQFPLTNQGKGRVCVEKKDNYDFKKAEPLTYRFGLFIDLSLSDHRSPLDQLWVAPCPVAPVGYRNGLDDNLSFVDR